MKLFVRTRDGSCIDSEQLLYGFRGWMARCQGLRKTREAREARGNHIK